MATSGIPVSDLTRRLGEMMNDAAHERWTVIELIDWANDAATEIVLRRPAARTVTETLTLVAGAKQEASEGTAQVLDIVRNVKANNMGTAVSIVDRQAMNAISPNWYFDRPGPARHYMIDERSPTSFWVWPPAVAGAQVEALVAKPPPKVYAESDMLDMRPEFMGAIVNWMLFRCHTKDSEYSQGNVAMLHYQAFADAIGGPAQAAQVNSATANSV